jgi:Lon protease-like protein
MSEDISLPIVFDGITRLFPLPNVVLFPRVTLPLHIFEPRYRQMTAHALAGDRLITMALLQPGFEAEYDQRPPLYPVACLGKILADQQMEDGRYNILLRGLSRVRIVNELPGDKLYREARVELLEEDASSSEDTEARQEEVARRVAGWLTTLGLPPDDIVKLLQSDLPVSALCDILAFALPLTIEFKQQLLEELHVDRRLASLLNYLQTNEPVPKKPPGEHQFPPEFSTN